MDQNTSIHKNRHLVKSTGKYINGDFSFTKTHMKDHEMSPKITKDHEISEIISDKMLPKIMKMRSPKIIKNVSFNMMTFHDIC